jgi:glycosyl transferase, family 25
MEIMEYFERAYAINLPHRADRRNMLTKQLEAVGIELAPPKIQFFQAIRPKDPGSFLSIGMRGCFLSHLAVLKLAREQNLSNVLIMEDDLLIPRSFKQKQHEIVSLLQQTEWNFVCFGHQENGDRHEPLDLRLPTIKKEESLAIYSELGYLPTGDHATPTHFYGVNGRILDRLIAYLEEVQHRPCNHPQGGATHLDGVYTMFAALNPDLDVLKVFPNFGFQASTYSDVHAKKWFEKIIILKQLVVLARQGKILLRNWKINSSVG